MSTPVVYVSAVGQKQTMFTIYETPIWRVKLWLESYEQNLLFMAENDTTYNRNSAVLDTVIIDFVEYLRVHDYSRLRKTPAAWMIDPEDPTRLFIHFENHNPPFGFLFFSTGELIGFSYGQPIQIGALKTYPLLLDIPDIEDSSDNLTYQRMSFASGNIVIDNSSGMLDELFTLFGNNITLLNYTKDQKIEVIRQFFIERYQIGLTDVNFSVMDKRSKLTFKAPNTFYTREQYPDIDENQIGKVIQDAYGYCRGVPGTAIDRNKIYNWFISDTNYEFNNWFEFKFARRITSIEEIWVRMQDVWIQVFPGLGIPGNNDPSLLPDSPFRFQEVNTHPVRLITIDAFGKDIIGDDRIPGIPITDQNKRALPENNDGRIAIWWRQSQRDNPGFLERRNGNSNAVKATGVFYPLHTPGDIIRDMMVHYGALPYEASYFDIEDWEEEMRGGAEIGIFLDQAKNIYDWIELMQNGAVMGFQLLIYRDLFTARVDNANREESFNIKLSEILNRDEIVAEFNGDYYATFTTINYNKEYTEKEYLTHVNKTRRNEILNIYQYDKEYTNNSFLIKEEDVILKSNILLEDFSKTRPIIRNIELEGLRWDEIKLFSTGYIDFNVELPRQMKAIQIYMEQRNMLGKLRVKIISVKRNQKQNKIYIDVIQSDRLDIIPPAIKDEDMIPLFIPTPIFNDNDLINGLLGVCLVCDGTTYFWGEYPEVNTSRFKDFLNKYSNYGGNDNGNTFTMPDFSGLTITGAGANRFVEILDQNGNRYSLPRYYASPNVGDVQGDAIRNITGSVHRNLSHSSVTGAFSGGGGGWWASAQQNSQGSHDLWFNASHVVPTADFNQPAAIPVIWVMRIK